MAFRKITKLDGEYTVALRYSREHYGYNRKPEWFVEVFKNNATINMCGSDYKTCRKIHDAIVGTFADSSRYCKYKLRCDLINAFL